MNIEMLELNAVVEAAKAEESFELLALAIEDLDLVGGGAFVGALRLKRGMNLGEHLTIPPASQIPAYRIDGTRRGPQNPT